MVVLFFSATIRPAFLRILKWPDNVDRASGKRSAISPAVMARLRSSRKTSRRVGSLSAWKTAFINIYSYGISPTTETVAVGRSRVKLSAQVADAVAAAALTQ